jgi:hypothetical protein
MRERLMLDVERREAPRAVRGMLTPGLTSNQAHTLRHYLLRLSGASRGRGSPSTRKLTCQAGRTLNVRAISELRAPRC